MPERAWGFKSPLGHHVPSAQLLTAHFSSVGPRNHIDAAKRLPFGSQAPIEVNLSAPPARMLVIRRLPAEVRELIAFDVSATGR